MAEVSTFRCDECGKLKEEANHWFKAARLQVDRIDNPAGTPRFMILTWGDAVSPDLRGPRGDIGRLEYLHLCGMGCAVKAMTKVMEQSG